jgi:hypothetical protein
MVARYKREVKIAREQGTFVRFSPLGLPTPLT